MGATLSSWKHLLVPTPSAQQTLRFVGNDSGTAGSSPAVDPKEPPVTTTTTQRPDPRDPVADPQQAGEAWVPPTWEEIVSQHSARVYRLAYRLTGNVHDAEDLTHDVFIRVFRSLHSS